MVNSSGYELFASLTFFFIWFCRVLGMTKFEILSMRANAINSSNPEVTCQFDFQAVYSAWGMFPTAQGTSWIQGLNSCLPLNLNVVRYQMSGGIWHLVGLNCYLERFERCQTRAMFWAFVIFFAVETWWPSFHSPHGQNSHWSWWCWHRLDESLQRKTPLEKLS